MSHIAIHRSHELTLDRARQAAETLAEQLADRYELGYHWQEDSLYFERSGVGGQIDLEPGMVRISVRLGFLLAPFKYKLEQEIHRQLDEIFQPPIDSA